MVLSSLTTTLRRHGLSDSRFSIIDARTGGDLRWKADAIIAFGRLVGRMVGLMAHYAEMSRYQHTGLCAASSGYHTTHAFRARPPGRRASSTRPRAGSRLYPRRP